MALLEPVTSRRSLAGQLMVFCCWLAITAVGAFLTPDPAGHGTHTQLGLPPCPSVLIFDRPCPGCGLTTSFTSTIHGDLPSAFSAHPLGPFLYLALTGYSWFALARFLQRRRIDTSSRPLSWALAAVAVAVFGFGAYRMIVSPSYGDAPESRFVKKLIRSE